MDQKSPVFASYLISYRYYAFVRDTTGKQLSRVANNFFYQGGAGDYEIA